MQCQWISHQWIKRHHRFRPGLAAGLMTLMVLIVAQGSAAFAGKHALLIGIGDYPKNYKLDGPRYDVEALRDELVTNWGFARGNITTLIDAQATRRGILSALDQLHATSRSGDDVFIYYSGHGTSAFDDELAKQGKLLGKWTGALMPYDYSVGLPERPTPQQWLGNLIIGTRDLKPRLARLDRDRFVFVVFDTCFSGYTVRSISRAKARWVSPPTFSRSRSIDFSDPFDSPVFGQATAEDPSRYPYQQLIYLASASAKERAEELPARYTIDRRPHGAMTNSLLKALRGKANSNRDDQLTYSEVFEWVRDDVTKHYRQTPQWLYPEARADLIHRAVFGRDASRPVATPDPVVPKNGRLWVRLDGQLGSLGQRIAALDGVRIAGGNEYDVRVARETDGLLALFHPSGDRIVGGFHDQQPRRLLERISRQVQVQALIDLTYPRQDFWLSLELPPGRGYLHGDERFEVTALSDRSAAFLMLNIDKEGTVSVLYPRSETEMRKLSRWSDIFEVVPPYGTEYLKLFAFAEPPQRLMHWANQKIDVLDPRFGDFLDFLENPGVRKAQTRRKLVTVGTLIHD